MIDREISQEELFSFLKIQKETSNSEIFKVCRKFQDDLSKDHDIKILNIGSIYWWIKDKRDELKKIV